MADVLMHWDLGQNGVSAKEWALWRNNLSGMDLAWEALRIGSVSILVWLGWPR